MNNLLFLLYSTVLHSTLLQSDFKGQVNQILNNYGLPVFGFFILVGTAVGVIQNYDKIVDKDGNGTRKEGMWNVGVILLYVSLGVGVIAAVVKLIATVKFKV